MEIYIVIPARLESSRLNGKVLLDINGKSVLQHVFDNLKECPKIKGVVIATDSKKIKEHAESFAAKVIMTSSDHKSGTDRIAEAIKELSCDYVINVQGDEPLIGIKHILPMIKSFEEFPECEIFTLYEGLTDRRILDNLNDVKLVTNLQNFALYFSRLPIPFRGISASSDFKKHIGVYGFKKDTLLKISTLERGDLEKKERLEQLRWLEHGYSIKAIEVDSGLFSVDTPEDYEHLKSLMEN